MRSPAPRLLVLMPLVCSLAACAGTEAQETVVESSAAALGSVKRVHSKNHNHAPVDCTQHYYGGSVIANAEIVSVYWTNQVDATITTNVPQFWADVMVSPYLDWLSEYNTVGLTGFTDGLPGSNQGIGHGTFLGAYTITPATCSAPPCTLTGAQIENELLRQLQGGHLPAPTVGCDGQPRTIYMIEFPQGVTINDATGLSCVDYCAYHSTVRFASKPVPYAVYPFMGAGSQCAAGCGTGGYIGRTTSTHAHELAEAITDPDVNSIRAGWYNTNQNCGELGDMCFNDGTTTVNGRTWVVQQLWSNQTSNCTALAPIKPVCTAANTPTGCRSCACADEGGSCSGATAACETDSTNVKAGFCVECATNAQCGVNSCTKSTDAGSDDTCAGGCSPIATCPSGACGALPDACGGTIACGGCATDQVCALNRCVVAPGDAGTPGGGAGGAGGTGGTGGAGGAGGDPGAVLVYAGDTLGAPPAGCSCQAGGLASMAPFLWLAALGLRRRRR